MHLEQAEAFCLFLRRLYPVRVHNRGSEHLETTADSYECFLSFNMAQKGLLETLLSYPVKVGDRILGARQDDYIGAPNQVRCFNVPELDPRLNLKRVEVGVVRYKGQMDDRYGYGTRSARASLPAVLKRDAVLLGQVKAGKKGEHTEHGPPGLLLQKFDPRFEQRDVPPELIDDESYDKFSFPAGEQAHRTDQ